MNNWKPIAECPYLGEPFLAALPVYRAQTNEFMHFDYAILSMDEGRLHFYDDQLDTGWDVNDYTLCLAFSVPNQ